MSMRIRRIKICLSRGCSHVVSAASLLLLSLLVGAQQPQNDMDFHTVLSADMIERMESYVNRWGETIWYEYVIEIGEISGETKARPINRKSFTNITYQVPEGITVKELLSCLPGLRRNFLGRFRLISKKRKEVAIVWNNIPLYPGRWHHPIINADSILSNGTAFVRIKTDPHNRYYGANINFVYYQNVSYDMVGAESEYVDLGLSVKWATHNVGATKPEEYGDYYAWGETENLNSGRWRVPTNDEINELLDNCKWTLASVIGVTGFLVTSKKTGYTDRSIFLPCLVNFDEDHGYWSSTLDASSPNRAFCLYLNDLDPFELRPESGLNSLGFYCTVRPVTQ